ncbi:DUF1659 domain-containing protein [Sporosarcina sp. GW1-11]|uniref:DUF1659 domain-containing protein n=1 Tax=Sporosarcina sp. GW1-11 TaxID=2899126 RepID=UPI00294E73CC|nr:DUF1659 domain-containing protein [Sporosarcina sp. GW1-11]MDV6377069.1 DUF1659 domain-containing protein [Sporosarcina sp. GW1-11]
MSASLEFNQATGRIHFNAGVNDKGYVIRKVKTYKNVTSQASAANLYTALTQLASLSDYPMIKVDRVITEDIQNN